MMSSGADSTKRLIEKLVRETGAADAPSAIRMKSTQALDAYVANFGEPDPFPLDLMALASFLGIKTSDALPAFSQDAEIVPDGCGGVEMHINPNRPETRRRFSVGHEITHTFFPDHQLHVWPRADSTYRDLSNSADQLEMLCDVGAAELVFPRRWFVTDAATVGGGLDLIKLASRYKASLEATVRRYAELHDGNVAAVFLSWKLKPSQKRQIGRTNTANIFGVSAHDEILDSRKLRIDYVIPSAVFVASGRFLARDKSVENNGAIHTACSTGAPADGEVFLDLGQASGRFKIFALPLWTPTEKRGPNGECAIVAIVKPLDSVHVERVQTVGRKLFEL